MAPVEIQRCQFPSDILLFFSSCLIGTMAAFLDAAVERLQVAITRDVPAYLKVSAGKPSAFFAAVSFAWRNKVELLRLSRLCGDSKNACRASSLCKRWYLCQLRPSFLQLDQPRAINSEDTLRSGTFQWSYRMHDKQPLAFCDGFDANRIIIS